MKRAIAILLLAVCGAWGQSYNGGGVYPQSMLNAEVPATLSNKTLSNPDLGGTGESNTVTAGTGGVTAGHVVQKTADNPLRYVNASTTTAQIKGIARATATVGNTFQMVVTGFTGCVVEGTVTSGNYWTYGVTDKSKCADTGIPGYSTVSNSARTGGVFQASGTDGQTVLVSVIQNASGGLIDTIAGAVIPASAAVLGSNSSRQIIAPTPNAASGPVVLDASGNLAIPLIQDDANTVSHVISGPAGLIDLKALPWIFQLQPPSYRSGPPALAYGATRTLVGTYDDSDYFTQGGAGTGLPNINGAFTGCFAFTVTSYSNSPVIFTDYDANGVGWQVNVTSGGNFQLMVTGRTAVTSLNQVSSGVQVGCVGMSGTGSATGYIMLNGGPVTSAALSYTKGTTPVCTFGRDYTARTGHGLTGTIDEAWFSSDAPSANAFLALVTNGMAQPGAGYRFPDTSGTKLHLLGRDFATNSWVTPQATLTTVGTVSSSTYSQTSPLPVKRTRFGISPVGISAAGAALANTTFYYLAAGNALDFSGDFSVCVVVVPLAIDISGTSIYVSNGVSEGTAGWQLVNESGVTTFWGTTGSGTSDVTATSGQVNTLCFGKAGANLVLKVNDRKMVSAAGTITASNSQTRLGMHWNYSGGFGGTLYEAWFSTDTPTDALFSGIVQNVLLAQ